MPWTVSSSVGNAAQLVGAGDSKRAPGTGGTFPVPFQKWSNLHLLTPPGRWATKPHASELLVYAGLPTTVEEDEDLASSCWRPAPLPDF